MALEYEGWTALKEAAKIIRKRENWCQGWQALDAENRQIRATDPEAVRFCLTGAISKVVFDGAPRLPDGGVDSDDETYNRRCAMANAAKDHMTPFIGDCRDVWEFNDNSPHASVIHAVTKAIAVAGVHLAVNSTAKKETKNAE